MNGLNMVLNQLGIKIDPKQIEQELQTLRSEIPKFANDMNRRVTKLEQDITDLKVSNVRIEQFLTQIKSALRNLRSESPKSNGGVIHDTEFWPAKIGG